ncbi:MAG: undecaprenyl-diphosphatase [Candidatus Binataceae bacterium]|jgi:undecaprenyl-diphosphatase|nr:undecaprenyl-diphosphatase [Candidatus Binataceae bacterium]
MATSSGFEAIVLGAVQGLAEFLPISSSAHLILVPWLLRWNDPGLVFDVALHIGTLVALLAYYWRDWLSMGASIFNGDRDRRRLLLMLIVASLPGALIGVLFEKQAESTFRSPLLIAIALALLGVALWFFDRSAPQTRKIGEVTFRDALLIGLSQAFAIIPGVSRSGSTITAARVLRLERADAANFSFLMATPIIAGAGLFEGRHLVHEGITGDVVAGFVTAAIFGLIAIIGLIRFVRTRTYEPFAWYRVILAGLVIVVYLMRR